MLYQNLLASNKNEKKNKNQTQRRYKNCTNQPGNEFRSSADRNQHRDPRDNGSMGVWENGSREYVTEQNGKNTSAQEKN